MKIERYSSFDQGDSEAQWSALVERACSDALFTGWHWLTNWWRCFGEYLSGSPFVLVAKDEQGEAIGIAPLYWRAVQLAPAITIRRMEFIGNSYSGPSTTRSEYLDFVCENANSDKLRRLLLEEISCELNWNELVLTDVRLDGPLHLAVLNWANEHGYLIQSAGDMTSYQVDTVADFSQYLASLGAGTRNRIYNGRRRLCALGDVSLKSASGDEIEEYFSILNELHFNRWGKRLYEGQRLEFHLEIARWAARSGSLNLSLMCLDGRPVSALYNIRLAGREYALQGGFVPDIGRRISLGMLHYGYLLEQAFLDPDIKVFDFLAGPGKSQDYKSHIATKDLHSLNLRVVRSGWLKRAYQVHGLIKKVRANTLRSAVGGAYV